MKAKKILVLVTVLSLSIAMLAGCGGKDTAVDDKDKNRTPAEKVEYDYSDEEEIDDDMGDMTDDSMEEQVSESVGVSSDMSIANALLDAFYAEAENAQDSEQLARTLMANAVLTDMSMDCVSVEPGFLNGFDADITGFNSGASFLPMIGSIPFVGYVFETDDPETLVEELTGNANLNWNICTMADEMVSGTSGNYVFFVMSPFTFD